MSETSTATLTRKDLVSIKFIFHHNSHDVYTKLSSLAEKAPVEWPITAAYMYTVELQEHRQSGTTMLIYTVNHENIRTIEEWCPATPCVDYISSQTVDICRDFEIVLQFKIAKKQVKCGTWRFDARRKYRYLSSDFRNISKLSIPNSISSYYSQMLHNMSTRK
jgi:hypothetical protein